MINFSFDGNFPESLEKEIEQHEFIEILDEEDGVIIFQAFPKSWDDINLVDWGKAELYSVYIPKDYIEYFPEISEDDFYGEDEFAISVDDIDGFNKIIETLKSI